MSELELTQSKLNNRPAYHVTAPRNWINDPCARLFWQGSYHLFYQHNPHDTVWGEMHWGHAVSKDLVTWSVMEIAMSPSAEGPDSAGCWSGCGRLIDGVPTIFYTGVSGEGTAHAESACIATGSGDLATLVRDPRNPIIPAVNPESGLRNYRDPFILRFDDHWLMLLGTGLRAPIGEPGAGAGGGAGAGAVVMFESSDLETWSYSGIVYSQPGGQGPLDTGPVWECPQLTRVGDDWVLIVSAQRPQALCYIVWFIGSFDGTSFAPRASGLIDQGDVFYAPAVFDAPDGRTLLWGWVQETDAAAAAQRHRAGALSLPRTIGIVNDRLVSRPALEFEASWPGGTLRDQIDLSASNRVERLGMPGPSYRLTFTVEVASGKAGVRLLSAVDGHEFAVYIERSHHGLQLSVTTTGGDQALVADIPANGSATISDVRVDIFVDDTIVEIFVEDYVALTTRMYPTDEDDSRVDLVAPGGEARFTSVELSEFSADAYDTGKL